MLRKIAATLMIVYLLAGVFLLPYFLRHELPALLLRQSGIQLDIGAAAFNPITFELSLSKVAVAAAGEEPLLQFDGLRINFELYALFGGLVRFKEIAMDAPRLVIRKDEAGLFNFASLQKRSADDAASGSASRLPAVMIDTLEIQKGSVAFFDHSKEVPFDVTLSPLGLRLNNIDTRSGEGMLRLFSHINDGGFIDIKSTLASMEPLVIDGSIEFRSGRLFTGWRYLREMIGIEIADGALHAQSRFHFDANDMKKAQLSAIAMELERLRIKPQTRHEDIFRLGSMQLAGGTLMPFSQQGHFERLEINDVMLHARRLSDGTLDWHHYFAQPESPEAVSQSNEAAEPVPWDVTLDDFSLRGLQIGIDDEAMMPVQHFKLNDFNLSAENIHSLGGYPLSYTMALRFNESFTCKSQGTLEHSALKGSGVLACDDLDLTWFNPYIDEAAKSALDRFDVVLNDAKASWSLPYGVEQNSTQISLMLSQAALRVENFDLRSAKERKPLAGFKTFTIDGVTLDSGKKEAYVENVVLERPQLNAVKSKEGHIDWNRLIQPKSASRSQADTDDAAGQLWDFRVNAIDLKQGSLLWRDASIATPAQLQIDPLRITIRDFRSDAAHPFGIDASLRLNQKSAFEVTATMQREPLQVESDVTIKTLQLPEANPYLAETLNLYLGRGAIDMSGKMHYAPGQNEPEMTLKGDIEIHDVLVNESGNNALLLGFDTVKAAPFTLQLSPDALLIESLGIHALYADIHVDANKSLNLSRLQKKRETPPLADGNDVNTSSNSVFPVTIVKLDFKEGVTDFRDDSLPLKFKTHVHNVNGSVYGISTQRDVTSYLNFNGDIDAYGAMKVDGSLRAGDPAGFTDIGVTFRNIALPDMSPYSANFAGRKIDEGKLFLDLKYKIVDAQIQGENSIVIKKIRLGDAIEGESSLPLGLAVALLEDAEGVIDIDMPVEGDMNNPDFKYGALVMNTLKNLILKVVSAPFSFLGSMLGIDGDSLKTIAYEAGRFELLPPEREKLDLLVKALEKRPKLALQISGAYDTATDTRALQIAKLEALVLERSGDKSAEAMQDPDFLKTLYSGFYGEAALEALHESLHQEHENDKAYAIAMQDALIEGLIVKQEVSVSELEFLARSRAVAVRDYLMQSQNIDTLRVTLGGNILAEPDEEGFVNAAMEIVPMQ